MISKKDFFKLMTKTKKDTVINQFYYEHRDLMELQNRIDKAIEYIKWNLNKNEELIEYFNYDANFNELLNILRGDE